MKDFLKNELSIGDKVAYARNPYSDLNEGYVIGFTPKGIRVGKTVNQKESPTVVFPYQVVKVFNQ